MNFRLVLSASICKSSALVGFYGVDVSVYMAFGNVFLADTGIQVDAFHVVMPFAVYVGIA